MKAVVTTAKLPLEELHEIESVLPATPEELRVMEENRALARYRVTALSDDVLAISHWIGDARFDLAAERILSGRRNLDLLAGYLSHLVQPIVKLTDTEATTNIEQP